MWFPFIRFILSPKTSVLKQAQSMDFCQESEASFLTNINSNWKYGLFLSFKDAEHFLNLILCYFHRERLRILVTYETPLVRKLTATLKCSHSTGFSFNSGVGFIEYVTMINKQQKTFLSRVIMWGQSWMRFRKGLNGRMCFQFWYTIVVCGTGLNKIMSSK
jgi:hypothetical protein